MRKMGTPRDGAQKRSQIAIIIKPLGATGRAACLGRPHPALFIEGMSQNGPLVKHLCNK